MAAVRLQEEFDSHSKFSINSFTYNSAGLSTPPSDGKRGEILVEDLL